MRNNLSFFMDGNGGSSEMFPMDPLMPYGFGTDFLSHISLIIDGSRNLQVSGSQAIQEAFKCFSKYAGAMLVWFASGSNSRVNNQISGSHQGSRTTRSRMSIQAQQTASNRHNLMELFWQSRCQGKFTIPLIFSEISKFTLKQLRKEAKQLQSIPLLSLAAALVPPFDNFSGDVLAVQLDGGAMETQSGEDQQPCEVEHRGCDNSFFQNLDWSRHAIEPRTGIEFPTILDNLIAGEKNSSFTSEVLVGTGSRIMKIIRIKSLKVYAFGFYVHPFDVCQKLGWKYASVPFCELNKQQDFYRDLLREDISMTVRLVVSCNGIKINTVRDVFEKSLRARLVKTNPDTDYRCLETFGSMFSQDIHVQAGTTINFRRTADGYLITEIGGNNIGAVQSRELCRAFFDMYIGDVPICEETKEEIGKNVASILRGC
ncbi:fatty-acid-binding protein 2 [Nicotiana sylvestris]|uniref:Fatty-acid-binding protein 2 n=2 Tax=Nicotiana TaxID=4085 RepID=A0A1S4CMA9_TOBAC|nr:PREDICTED: fatty-acid-binding protein 2 [Nicotiana sylvestris]XP_016502064.1 PREDICTED: fatty-acid-binding protein 2-like [Nicotiana tabacum]